MMGETLKMTADRSDVPVETLYALRHGEQWAYNEVYVRFASPLRAFITALIHNEEDASELNHDVFMSLWVTRERIVPERGIRGFLYTRAKNLAMNYFDHERVKRRYEDFCARDTYHSLPPDLHMIADETRTLIEILLQGLPRQKERIFRLRHEEGLTVEEIADQLGLSQSTIRNNLSMVTTAIRNVISLYVALFLQSRV